MLRLKAKEFCVDPKFKASLGWYQNWKWRHSISLRTKTTLAQHLPNDLKEQTVKFHRFVIAARQRYGYPLTRIYNMDETPMRFEPHPAAHLNSAAAEPFPLNLLVLRKGALQWLVVAADGKKLQPVATFKGVRTPRDLLVPDSLRVTFHKKGWMDEPGKHLWFHNLTFIPFTRVSLASFFQCFILFWALLDFYLSFDWRCKRMDWYMSTEKFYKWAIAVGLGFLLCPPDRLSESRFAATKGRHSSYSWRANSSATATRQVP